MLRKPLALLAFGRCCQCAGSVPALEKTPHLETYVFAFPVAVQPKYQGVAPLGLRLQMLAHPCLRLPLYA